VNDVSSLFRNHGTKRCGRGFQRRAGGAGIESVAQKELSG
jgi:hypothetical protein